MIYPYWIHSVSVNDPCAFHHFPTWSSEAPISKRSRKRDRDLDRMLKRGHFWGYPIWNTRYHDYHIYIISYFWFCYTQFMVGGFGGTIFETNPHWDSTSHHGVKRCWTLLDILGNSSWEQETPLVYLARFLLKDYIMMYTMIHI